jgi:hypothetical protein
LELERYSCGFVSTLKHLGVFHWIEIYLVIPQGFHPNANEMGICEADVDAFMTPVSTDDGDDLPRLGID